MAKYIAKRILYMIFVAFIMTFVLFFLFNLVPGDPARAEVEAMKELLTPLRNIYTDINKPGKD